MGDINTRAREVFRDYVTDGVPSSDRHEPIKSSIRTLFAVIDEKVETVTADLGNVQAAAEAGTRYFPTLAEMNAYITAEAFQTADVEEDGNRYYWDAVGEEWVLRGPNPDLRLTTLEEGFGMFPLGTASGSAALIVVNQGGWLVSELSQSAVQTLIDNESWISELPQQIDVRPTGGAFVAMNEAGWLVTNYDDAPSTDADAETEGDTVGKVAAVLKDEVEDEPLLVGENIFLTVGESKADSIDFMSDAFDQICTQMSTAKPSGATVDDAVYFHNAYKASEVIADWAAVKTVIDTAFTAGAECVSMLSFVEMANDMGASGAINSPDTWESDILQLKAMVQHYCLQKYVGTAAAVVPPVPPVFMVMDCTWAKASTGTLLPDIPLRGVEMSNRIHDFGIAVPDYIAAFSDDRHYNNATERKRIAAYLGLANYWWRILKRKYRPTQVIDQWFDGTSAFLRVRMPHPPLVADTALVSSITNNGLEAFTADGAAITITGTSIVGGGQVIKVDQASSWVAGDRIQGGITPTTAAKSGRTDGPRLMYRDSSPYQVDLGAGPVSLYSPMLPFKISL